MASSSTRRLSNALAAVMAAGGYALAAPASAQAPGTKSWPSAPIHLYIGYTPGSSADTVSRLVANAITPKLGQPVVVEARPGAAGTIAANLVAKAAPDGYSMVIGTPTAHATAQFLYNDLPYDPITDLDPVALIGNTYFVLTASTQVGAKTVKELVETLKAKPGQLNYASSGEGGIAHLGALIFSDLTGTTATHVPYKSATQALLDLVAGRVQYFFSTIPPAEPLAKAGKIRILAVAGPRQSALPDVPGMAEAGYPQIELKFWFASFMPAHTPREIVTRMNREINTALKEPAVVGPLTKQGVLPEPVSPEKLGEIVKKDAEVFRQVALKANFKKSSLKK